MVRRYIDFSALGTTATIWSRPVMVWPGETISPSSVKIAANSSAS